MILSHLITNHFLLYERIIIAIEQIFKNSHHSWWNPFNFTEFHQFLPKNRFRVDLRDNPINHCPEMAQLGLTFDKKGNSNSRLLSPSKNRSRFSNEHPSATAQRLAVVLCGIIQRIRLLKISQSRNRKITTIWCYFASLEFFSNGAEIYGQDFVCEGD